MPSKRAAIRAALAVAPLLLSAAVTPARTEVVGLTTTPDFGKLPLPIYDLDGNGIITVVDIMKVAVHWGETCE
jgi:hypothetical protein